MNDSTTERNLLQELDMRQDEVLRQLDQLNDRIEAVLRDVTGHLTVCHPADQ